MGYSLARSTGISASYSICGRFAPRRPLCPSWTNDFTLELAPLRGRRSVPRFGLNLERNGWNFWRSERNQRSILFSILFFFERGGGCVCGTVCRTVTIFADLVSRLRMTGGAQGWPVNPVGGTALLACMLSLEGHFKPSVVTFMRR